MNEPRIARFVPVYGAATVKSHVVAVLDTCRDAFRAATPRDEELPSFDELVAATLERLDGQSADALVRVINGTGILLHTNLGRAPLAQEALDAIAECTRDYSNLEFDLATGTRGSRYDRVVQRMQALTGAPAALVVNNCTAAMLLVLDTFARGREVLVARGSAIEIGGGFRLPDILARSGARLIDVGATNRTYLTDFERALGPESGLILHAHASNYRILGFTADVPVRALAALARRVGVPLIEDLGTGALVDLAPYGMRHERTAREAVADGADVVTFSADKLLGGPQAGIIVGSTSAIARMRANPFVRAVRVDKATLAALDATLRLHASDATRERIPLYRMLATPLAALQARAALLASGRPAVHGVAIDGFVGGGTLPLDAFPSFGITVASDAPANTVLARWRRAAVPVIGRVVDDRAALDLRTIDPRDDAAIAALLSA